MSLVQATFGVRAAAGGVKRTWGRCMLCRCASHLVRAIGGVDHRLEPLLEAVTQKAVVNPRHARHAHSLDARRRPKLGCDEARGEQVCARREPHVCWLAVLQPHVAARHQLEDVPALACVSKLRPIDRCAADCRTAPSRRNEIVIDCGPCRAQLRIGTQLRIGASGITA
jgi:hypothetical protein